MGGQPAPRSVSTPPMRPAPMAPAASDPTTLPPLAVPTATEEGTEASAASPGAASPSGRSLHPVPAGQGAVRFATSSRQGSRPGTSPLSVQDLTLGRSGSRAGPRPPALDVGSPGGPGAGSGGGGGKPLTPTGFHASIGGRLSATGPTGPQPTRYASSPTGGRFHHTITASRAADGLVGGAAAAAAEAQRMGNFRVSRGMVYSVFQDLDDFDTGRLTYSAFEQAACKVGMKPDQARRFFRYLDPQARGYTTMSEWGAPQLEKQMEAFTRLYVQNTRGPDGRPRGINEVRSAAMAVQMALTKLQLKRNGRSVSLERLVEAFRFIDRDASGALSPSEMEDALNALGIFVTPEVVGSIMTAFDKDGSGGVDYLEFVRALFPMLGQTAHVVR
ncbi:hypothetical protein HYH03_000093 [Edaphochlamys debaryana]|uniref:EF-hand domain-containing protein n=1 Tax=Edaphochlamys debaryana TaxID=47281 RepID=A0A835YF75_9CHLO|nr:hypothetical protein HYH03_000093 [Edaphochlamys debaryana]|eukprot:KAG2501588.1 hypothetical protein HYH03_000093 [Edaphochlamys debaryana]